MTAIQLRIAIFFLMKAVGYLRRRLAALTEEQRAEIKAIMDQPEGERWYEKAKHES